MVRPTVLLFDIDGTLIDGGGAGRRAMEAAFAEVVGDAAALRDLPFAGMTDPSIVREGLRRAGHRHDAHDDVIPAVLVRYLELLGSTIAGAAGYRLHAGVVELLDAISPRSQCAIGLGTGNLERGAMLKLGAVGIAERFAFGGYGSDAEDRAALVGIGAERGARRLGLPRPHCRVVVIGDTPRDIAAAHACGAECLAVATSMFTLSELRAAGADHVVADLTDPAAASVLLMD